MERSYYSIFQQTKHPKFQKTCHLKSQSNFNFFNNYILGFWILYLRWLAQTWTQISKRKIAISYDFCTLFRYYWLKKSFQIGQNWLDPFFSIVWTKHLNCATQNLWATLEIPRDLRELAWNKTGSWKWHTEPRLL